MPTLPLHRVAITLGERSYHIHIGSGLLGDADSWAGLPAAADALIVSNVTVAPLYAQRLAAQLATHHRRVLQVVLPDGEAHKTAETLNLVYDALLGAGCDRKTVLYALGGGVVGDMAGFAAACYMRGVPFVQVPKRELSAGLAEVIKYGPIADVAFFDWIEANLDALMARDKAALAFAVQRSCEIKAWVVGQDEREGGLRAILNFGHTFGHAIETGLGYGAWLHGEAVACGMVLAAELSARLGLVDAGLVPRLQRLCQRAGLPVLAPPLSVLPITRWMDLMRVDKKAEGGEIRFVVIAGLGRAAVRAAPDALVAEVISAHAAPEPVPAPLPPALPG